MKVFRSITTLLALLAITAGSAFAGLPDGTRLTIEAGSYVEIEGGPSIPLTEGADGLVLGVPLAAVPGSFHPGWPDGNSGETGGIVQSFTLFGNTGTFWTEGTAIHDNGDGTVDMTGLRAAWHITPSISFAPALGELVSDGVTYALDYAAVLADGPFVGIPVTLHLEGFVEGGGPAIGVAINLDGDTVRECSEPGGTPVVATADVTLVGGAVLESLSWTVDGVDAGTGEVIQPFLSLGNHTIAVMATADTGETATASVDVVVKDTTDPMLDVAFIDSRSGARITQIERANVQWVIASYPATDICDPAPMTEGVGGFAVTDGDVLKIQGNNDAVILTTSQITLSATAADASGNVKSGKATLTLTQ
ncbi:MAG: hypothetical protein PVF51_09290 [Nitrospirota bacterium]|jgi:hypothetical protein